MAGSGGGFKGLDLLSAPSITTSTPSSASGGDTGFNNISSAFNVGTGADPNNIASQLLPFFIIGAFAWIIVRLLK
jgi:hypothetical protein